VRSFKFPPPAMATICSIVDSPMAVGFADQMASDGTTELDPYSDRGRVSPK